MSTQDGTPEHPCFCACHVYPGTYPTSQQRPCSMCGHVNEEGYVSGWNGRNGWVRDNADAIRQRKEETG
jgi:hypothetical protein